MNQEIQFCTSSDGVRIAYATTGDGPPLVKVANWLSHLDYDWESPVWRHWWRALSRDHTLIRYDDRGCGLSDFEVDDFSLDAWISDLEAVIEALGLDRFPLLGISRGAAIAVGYAFKHPEKVSHLILYGGYATGRDVPSANENYREELALFLDLIRVGWGKKHSAFFQVYTNLFIPGGSPEQIDWFNDLQRISVTPENAVKITKGANRLDVRQIAPEIRVPALVMHARHDAVVVHERGRRLASLIPGARFVTLDSANHILLEEEPAWRAFLREVRSFLGVDQSKSSSGDSAEVERARQKQAHWEEVSAMFKRVVDLPREERLQVLDAAGNEAVKADVEMLLDMDDSGSFIDELHESLAASIEALQHNPTIQAGDTVAHYKIIEQLGGGGMGVVYKARDMRLDRTVALKFLSPDMVANQEAKKRLQLEARAASILDHANICTLYDIAETPEGGLFLVMAFYSGQTLKEILEAGPLPLDRGVSYAYQLANGLSLAHERGIIHRDVKPANIMITDRDQVKILDFGVAKIANVSVTKTGATLGTPAYMSPEQIIGEMLDARTDLWSLGVVMYEMLSGKRPFGGDSHHSVMYAVQHNEPQSIRQIRSEVPAELENVVERLLQKDPKDRYPGAEALAEELAVFLPAGKKDGTSSLKKRVWKSRASRKWWIAAGILLVLLIGLILRF